MKMFFSAAAALGCITNLAWSQAFNVDFGGSLSNPPSSAYSAGSGQSGFWNAVGVQSTLRDTSGLLTSATFGANGGINISDIPGATGDDELFMESSIEFGNSSEGCAIGHLKPGKYDLYLYSWNIDHLPPRTVFLSVLNGVTTVEGTMTTQATWPGMQVLGETYARLRVEVITGKEFLRIKTGNLVGDFDAICGIQLVPVPTPSSVLPLLGALLCTGRRRR